MRGVRIVRAGVGVLLALAVVLMAGCGGGGGGGTGGGNEPGVGSTVEVGTPRTVQVTTAANQVVADGASGLTFVFPTAGAHQLTIAPLVQAPVRPFTGGRGVQITRSTDFPLTLRFPVSSGGTWTVIYYAPAIGCYDGGNRPDRDWQNIPIRTPAAGFASFDLPPAGGDPVTLYYANVPPWACAPGFEAEFQRTRTALLSCSADVNATLRNVAVPLSYRAAGQLAYYQRTTAYGPNLYFPADAELDAITHGACHYLTHMLMTDGQWDQLQSSAPRSHGWGVLGSRNASLAEDYAYYLQYVTGRQSPGRDVTDVQALVAPTTPRAKDVPSLEGFAAVLLYHLRSTDTGVWTVRVPSFAQTDEFVPNIGATAGDVAMLLHQGATNLNELLGYLESFAQAHQYSAEALEAIVERLGWSYSCQAKLVSSTVHTAVNVQVVKVVPTATPLTMQFTTPVLRVTPSSSGTSFTLPRVFPGSFEVRVWKDGQSPTAFTRSVDRNLPTTTTPNLGNLNFNG